MTLIIIILAIIFGLPLIFPAILYTIKQTIKFWFYAFIFGYAIYLLVAGLFV